ncbi:hypothetical protein [Radiobacillus sp. PE A8.2]|uniref:hypothetical protein n=1 Tax=Radiobacillus sp. PE A8.2 TaxID=3380349 RepID=UPI003890D90D
MFVDIVGELQNDLYPMYVYFTFIASIVCSFGVLYLSTTQFSHKQSKLYDGYNLNAQHSTRTDIHVHMQDIRIWITKKTKRKEGPEDDSDNHNFSAFYFAIKKRGGKLCLKHLYLRSVKNIAY